MAPSPQAGRSRPVTINDIAKLSDVAASTVSRALNNPGRVNPMTRERIRETARQLNYIPNSQARPLTSGRTGPIALFVSDVTNPFYFGITRGAQHALKAGGYTHLFIDTENSGELEVEMLHRIGRSLAGAILAASRLPDQALAALALQIPLVTINRNVRGIQSVIIDTPAGIQQAADHLLSLGHHDIVYVSGPTNSWSNVVRRQAMRSAGTRLGLRVTRVGPFPPGQPAGPAAANAVLNTGATACVVFNDLLAISMLIWLRERGVRVPDDLSMVGCDDIFGADFCNPPLTTLTAPVERAGLVAASMLLSRLSTRSATEPVRQSVVLPTYLTVRGSSGPAPAANRLAVRVRAT